MLLGRVHQANKEREAKTARIMAGDTHPDDLKDDDDPVLKDLRSG